MVHFLSLFPRETTLGTSHLLYYTPSPFLKGSSLKGKLFASFRSKFFPFRVDPFSEGKQEPF